MLSESVTADTCTVIVVAGITAYSVTYGTEPSRTVTASAFSRAVADGTGFVIYPFRRLCSTGEGSTTLTADAVGIAVATDEGYIKGKGGFLQLVDILYIKSAVFEIVGIIGVVYRYRAVYTA